MMEFDKKAAGRVIRRLRLERRLSQEVFSGFAGLARSHLAISNLATNSPILKPFGASPTPLRCLPISWFC